MENLEFSVDEVFQEVQSRMQTQGAFTRDEYDDLVEEVLEEKREEGLLDDDEDIQGIRDELAARWEEVAESEGDGKKDEDAA